MTSEQELKGKVKFVEDLNATILEHVKGINSIRYDLLDNLYGGITEYLVVQFRGGALSVRNCTGNSCAAILEELAKLIQGGYYNEVTYYNSLKDHM